jgi:hypothetical protein
LRRPALTWRTLFKTIVGLLAVVRFVLLGPSCPIFAARLSSLPGGC